MNLVSSHINTLRSMKKPPLRLDFYAHWEIIAEQKIGNGNFCCFIAHPHSTRVLMAHKAIMCLSSSLLTLFTLQMRTTNVKKTDIFVGKATSAVDQTRMICVSTENNINVHLEWNSSFIFFSTSRETGGWQIDDDKIYVLHAIENDHWAREWRWAAANIIKLVPVTYILYLLNLIILSLAGLKLLDWW